MKISKTTTVYLAHTESKVEDLFLTKLFKRFQDNILMFDFPETISRRRSDQEIVLSLPIRIQVQHQ